MIHQAHIFVSGFVQGVGYRHFVRKNAQQLGLMGWVKNTPDGRVEVLAQGEKEDLEKLIELCRKGPFLAEIENVEVVWEEIKQDYPDFQITS